MSITSDLPCSGKFSIGSRFILDDKYNTNTNKQCTMEAQGVNNISCIFINFR